MVVWNHVCSTRRQVCLTITCWNSVLFAKENMQKLASVKSQREFLVPWSVFAPATRKAKCSTGENWSFSFHSFLRNWLIASQAFTITSRGNNSSKAWEHTHALLSVVERHLAQPWTWAISETESSNRDQETWLRALLLQKPSRNRSHSGHDCPNKLETKHYDVGTARQEHRRLLVETQGADKSHSSPTR